MAIVPVTKAVRRTKAASVENNKIIDNQIDIDSRVTTNAAAINTNEAAILSLAATGVPGLTANFNIVEWDYLDSTTGIVPGQEYYRFNKPPGPTGELGDFTDTTIELTPPRDIDEIRWQASGAIRFYGASGTDSTWGTSLKANTTLSLYVYTKGSTTPTLTEYELASGTTFTWGAGNAGVGIQYTAALPAGMSETTEIRFLVAEKGQSANINTYLGLHIDLPVISPTRMQVGSTYASSTIKDGFWYDTGIPILHDPGGRNFMIYEVRVDISPVAQSQYGTQVALMNFSGRFWQAFRQNPSFVSGTTEYADTQTTLFSPTTASAGVFFCRTNTAGRNANVWVCPIFQNQDPMRIWVTVFIHGYELGR